MRFLIEQSTNSYTHAHTLQDFCAFVCGRLGILEMPTLSLVDSTGAASFGSYRPSSGDVTVATGDRHIADVLRTLAHELVHHVQILSDSPLDLEGLEYEANAVAGMLMREYNREHPELYGVTEPVEGLDSESESGQSFGQGVPTNPPYPTEVAEEAPVNAAGSGAVAGLGVGPQGEPGIQKTTKTPMFKRKPFKQFREQLKETPWQTF